MAVFKGMKENFPDIKLYVGGCASEVLDLQKRYPFIDGVFRRRNMIQDLATYFGYDPKSDEEDPISNLHCVKIQTGCARSCGFCKKAYLKMPLCSKPIAKVLMDVKDSVSKGHHDIILLAENATEYGIDLDDNIRLIDLLKAVVEIDGVESLYVSALCIDELVLNPELVDYIKNCAKIHKVQLEIQSLIPEVRKNMRLTSTVDDVLKLLGEFSEKYIITNIMLGYPGETTENFKKQLKLIEKYGLYYVQINVYDNTPLVYGNSFEQIPKSVVSERVTMITRTMTKVRNRKATDIRMASKNEPVTCIYTTEGRFEIVGHAAIVELSKAPKCTSGQKVKVRVTGSKKLFSMFDPDQTMVLGGVQV